MQMNHFLAAPVVEVSAEVTADRISSAAGNLKLRSPLSIVVPETPVAGDVVAVRVLEVNPHYSRLELADGSEASLERGEVVLGVLGVRKALHGFSGRPPARLREGAHLYLLNKGGVIGECTAFHRDLGWPTRVEYLGTVFKEGRVLNLKDSALPLVDAPLPDIPVVIVAGTCMNAGKTTVCRQILERFSEKGFRIHAGKVAGVACRQDVLKMEQSGAFRTLSFQDFGLPSTAGAEDLPRVARSLVHYLADSKPDFILLELGDGILGGYEVTSLFVDPEFMRHSLFMILCANDLMGVWGALQWMKQHGIQAGQEPPLLISGPVTDSGEGIQYIEENLKLPAANAFDSSGKICTLIFNTLMPWLKSV